MNGTNSPARNILNPYQRECLVMREADKTSVRVKLKVRYPDASATLRSLVLYFYLNQKRSYLINVRVCAEFGRIDITLNFKTF